MVSVKDVEEVFGEFARISRGEEPLMEAPEFILADVALWIVSNEILVPEY